MLFRSADAVLDPVSEKRDLERHQLGVYIAVDWSREFDGNLLLFESNPFRRSGIALELNWRSEKEASQWRFHLSHVETDLILMTDKKAQFQRVELAYVLPF